MSGTGQTPDAAKIEQEFAKDIARLNRMTNNFFSLNVAEYAFDRLSALPPTPNSIEFMLEVEALTTGLVTSYGRLFTSSDGSIKLKDDIVPDHLRPVHDEIMDFRNRRYAHHGAHPSITTSTTLSAEDQEIVLDQQMSFEFRVGVAAHWGPLIVWLREYLHDRIQSELQYLSSKSGFVWRMRQGAPPSWVIEASRGA